MNYIIYFTLLISFPAFSQQVSVIPLPASLVYHDGVFSFRDGMCIKTNAEDEEVANIIKMFRAELSPYIQGYLSKAGNTKTIFFRYQHGVDSSEAYHILITKDTFLIESSTFRGLFYGSQTANQILESGLDVRDSSGARYITDYLRCIEVRDAPKYPYRGLELDVSRHFFSKDTIKKYIDMLAELKMNYFHWHLTDDQGWRIEIRKYPKLTSVGAWRIEKDGSKYGGYYTQDDIREIVEYARQRYITIVPEIEMPGHSSAAIAAYPWLCFDDNSTIAVPNSWGVKKEIYSVKDSTFTFLKDVLDEVCSLFPGKYLHIGGDEVPKQRWKKSAIAQKVKETNHLKNEEELQHYFMNRIEDYLSTKGKQCIGWGEIVKGGLSKDVIVMSWLDKKAGIKAAKAGNKVIMAPRFFCYFDYPQSIGDKKHAWWMTYLPLRKVYHFEPTPKWLPADKRKLILGGQANVWTEYITNVSELSYQVVPRIEAMAEALWSNTKNYRDFKKRLAVLNGTMEVLIVP